jgi:hypothetical protein
MPDPKSPDPQGTLPQSPESIRKKLRASSPDLRGQEADDDLTERKKDLVEAVDQLVAPLQEILKLMQRHQVAVILVLIILFVTVGVAVHTTFRIAKIEESLVEVMTTQFDLQKTAARTATQFDHVEQQQASQSQITIESSVNAKGDPTAVVVLKPPTSSPEKHLTPVVLPIGTAVASMLKPRAKADAAAPPAPPSNVTFKIEAAP